MNSPRFVPVVVAACLAVAVLLGSALRADAFTVTAENLDFSGPNVVITDSNGVPVPVGLGVIAVGYFTFDDAAVSAATSAAQLEAGFRQFGDSTSVNGGGFGVGGVYSFGATEQVTGGNVDVVGETIYTFIGNALDLGSSTEVLVFKHTNTLFASDITPGARAFLSASEIPPGEVLVGGFPGADIDVGFGPQPSFVLQSFGEVIPEPSRVMLSAMAMGFILFRRRR